MREGARGGGGEGEETGGVRKVVFCSLELETDARVFVPRVGTAEVVARRAQELVSLLICANPAAGAPELKRVRVLDLGTGTGCLLLATMIGRGGEGAASRSGAGGGGHAEGAGGGAVFGVGVDICCDAIALSARNAQALGVHEHTKWVCSDFGRLHEAEVRRELGCEPFDLILVAPPESSAHRWARPKWEMRDHEPSSTTVAGCTGLEGYEAVIHSLARCRPPLLVDNGWLMVRVNARQHQNVRRLFQERSACRSASLSY